MRIAAAITYPGDREGEPFLADSNPDDGTDDRDYDDHDPAGDGDGNDGS